MSSLDIIYIRDGKQMTSNYLDLRQKETTLLKRRAKIKNRMDPKLRDAAEIIIENADYNATKNAIVQDIRRLAFKFGPENIPDVDKKHFSELLGHTDPEIVVAVAQVLMEEE